jgi:hypothetical protein
MSDVASASESQPAEARSGPPVMILALAALCVATAAALVPQDEMVAHVLGYVVASVLAIVLVGIFRRFDLSRRRAPGYHPRPGVGRLATVVLLAGFVVAGFHVWSIATEWAS